MLSWTYISAMWAVCLGKVSMFCQVLEKRGCSGLTPTHCSGLTPTHCSDSLMKIANENKIIGGS